MTAVEITSPGGPDALSPLVCPTPRPAPNEVLIKVAAAGVNRPDILQRQGLYPVPKGASPLPGLEVSGEVVMSDDAGKWAVGDRVVALTNGGGYAEYVTVPTGQVLPLPRGWTMSEGAALPETVFTVEQTLVMRAGLTKSQSVLIHGGAGGIGGAALQRAKLAGANPILCTVSSTHKADYARRMGATHAINYREEDFLEQTLAITKGRGVDIVLDMIGGPYLDPNMKALAQGGTLISLALLGGARAEIDLARMLTRHLTLFGSTLRARAHAEKAGIATHLLAHVWPSLVSGQFQKPHLTTFALREAAAAHRAMDHAAHLGKIVLVTAFGEADARQ